MLWPMGFEAWRCRHCRRPVAWSVAVCVTDRAGRLFAVYHPECVDNGE